MRAFVTGATGFIGGRVARRLATEGHEVTALVRTPSKAGALADLGVDLHPGDITDPAGVEAGVKDHDVVFHLAAWIALGARDRDRMHRINVEGTENVLRAAAEADVAGIVYCSSVAAIGPNPPGVVGDETSRHDGTFASLYEETKHEAHRRARALAAEGAPVTTVLPCAVYGPGDTSLMGTLIGWYAKRRLLALPFADAAISFVHVDDVVGGALAAAERGRPGEDYLLGGDNDTIGGLFERAAPTTGIRAPRVRLNVGTLRWLQGVGPISARLMKQEPDYIKDALANVRESWMFSSAKAERELGYTWRDAPTGLAETVRALSG